MAVSAIGRRTLLAALPVVLAGCSTRRDPNALRVWAMSYEGDYSPLLMPAFTAATGIGVEVQSLPWTAAHEKLLTARAGNALPDVLMLPNGWIGEFAMIGALAPVPTPALLDDIFPDVLETVRYRERSYGVPWSVAPQVQYFRRDLLAADGYATPPDDWRGWRAMALRLKRRRPDDFVFLMLLNWPGALFTMLSQAGAPLLRDHNTRGAFRDPAARAALNYYASLFADGLAPRALSTEVQDPLAAFAQGQFAVWPSSASTLLDLSRRSVELPPGRWGTAVLAGPRGPGPASGHNACLCVAATTRRPDEAWALIRHMTSAPSELRFQRLIGNLPARASAWNAPQLATPVLSAFARQMQLPASTPRIVEWERIQAEVQLIAERVVRGLLTVDEGLVTMDGRIDRLLAKRRALVDTGRIAA